MRTRSLRGAGYAERAAACTRAFVFTVVVACVIIPTSAAAQQPAEPSTLRPLRVAKWSAAGVSLAAAVYGFTHNQRADDAYEELESLCQADRQRCAARTASGAYSDAVLESQYQEVRRFDRRARAGLIAGQVGIAASVALFILDLRNQRPPPNIPYDPHGLELIPARDGGVSVRLRLELPRR